jgi:hypothetical protein
VVVEEPEEPVDPHVHAGRLHHGGLVRRELDSLGVDFRADVAI